MLSVCFSCGDVCEIPIVMGVGIWIMENLYFCFGCIQILPGLFLELLDLSRSNWFTQLGWTVRWLDRPG